MIGAIRYRRQGSEVTGISERINGDDLNTHLIHKITHNGRTDEASTAGDQNFHDAFPLLMMIAVVVEVGGQIGEQRLVRVFF